MHTIKVHFSWFPAARMSYFTKQRRNYEYDSMNQLVRENLYYGENDSANSTYAYSYDSYGNMLGKYRYAYTTGSIANKLGITVAEYQYTDSQWGDLLTAVTDGTVSTGSKQNSTVSYDEMGNPTRYLGATMTWAGKQLKYWGKSGKYVNFAYNEDGIRTQKNSDGILINYYYNGSLLIGMTVGSGSSAKILRFSYDASGNAVAVDYSTDNGSTFNTYYYLRNAQNDIVKLIDNSGSTVVEYCYDSWGKLLSTSGSLASTLGKNNPFRYRGYVYDEETGFYYLQNRYYNPEVGRFISADDTEYLGADGSALSYNLFAYCLNNPVNRTDADGNWSLPNWAKVAVGAVAIAGLAVATVCTGGAAGVIAGAALTGAISGGISGAVSGAISGSIENGWEGALDGVCTGFMSGTLIGGITGAATSGLSMATGAVKVVGSAQKTGTILHKAASNLEAGKMALNPVKYSKITLNRSLNTAGLSGRRVPDVIGIARNGSSKLIEVVSKSQTVRQMTAKCISMVNANPGASYKVVGWAATISRLFR